MTFGARLRRLREQNRWTQQQLGEKTGISPRVLGYYENDRRLAPAITAITKLCQVLQTTPDYLILGACPSNADNKYRSRADTGLWVADAQTTFETHAYTAEELAVLEYARKLGMNASQLKKAVDLYNMLYPQ
ncbi:MAG: helix-turn-helix domain-containing protein [Bacillota bacterium]